MSHERKADAFVRWPMGWVVSTEICVRPNWWWKRKPIA